LKKAIRHFIIEKSREVFEQKGYTNTTIEDIAKASDISKPTLYNYFSGKDDIFRSVVELANSEMDELIAPIIKGPELFTEKLTKLTYEFLNHVNKNRGILKIAFHESHMFIEAIDNHSFGGLERLLEATERRVNTIKGFFEDGKQQGFILENVPVDLIAVFYVGILGEFSLGYILGKEGMANLDLLTLTDHITTILARGILKP
jgi:AcrR family transcriptional regulator